MFLVIRALIQISAGWYEVFISLSRYETIHLLRYCRYWILLCNEMEQMVFFHDFSGCITVKQCNFLSLSDSCTCFITCFYPLSHCIYINNDCRSKNGIVLLFLDTKGQIQLHSGIRGFVVPLLMMTANDLKGSVWNAQFK